MKKLKSLVAVLGMLALIGTGVALMQKEAYALDFCPNVRWYCSHTELTPCPGGGYTVGLHHIYENVWRLECLCLIDGVDTEFCEWFWPI